MTLWRLILALMGLTYAGFGFAYLFNPVEMAALTSLTLTAPAARIDFRATYGGLSFGIGVFLLLCALRREFVRVGLFAGACALVGMATARTVGLLLDGFSVLHLMVVLIEWIGASLATWGALVTKPEPHVLPPPIEDPTPDGDDLAMR